MFLYNPIVVLETPVLFQDHSHLLQYSRWKYHLYNWFPGAAFDDLEVQGLWTGDFGTGNGVWRVNSGGTTSSATGPVVPC